MRNKALNGELLTDRFDEFWKLYPRKTSKKKAYEIWVRQNLDSKADEIIAQLRQQVELHAPWQEEKRFIPYPTTYLNQERWTDEVELDEFTEAFGPEVLSHVEH